MKIPSDKRKKHLYSFFTTLIVVYSYLGITAFASKQFYRNVPYEVSKHFVVRTIPNEWLRSIGYTILCFLGKVVDFMYSAVDTLSKLNLYNLIQNTFDFKGLVYPIAWTVLSLSLVIGAIFLMTHYEKFQMSEFLRNIITSIVLIVTLPSFFNALSDFRDEGVDVVNGIDVTGNNSSSITHTLGEQIIASNIVAVEQSADEKKVIHYNDLNIYGEASNHISVYDLYINYWLANDSGNFKYKYIGRKPQTSKYVDVSEYYDTLQEKANLLGVGNHYYIMQDWENPDEKDWFMCTDFGEYTVEYYSMGKPVYKEYELNRSEYEDKVLEYLAKNKYIVNANLSETVKDMIKLKNNGLEYALEKIDDKVYREIALPMAQDYNEDLSINNSSYAGQYQLERLIDADDMQDMDILERLRYIYLYDEGEAIYMFDFSFLETFLVLIITIICLVFAGLKIAALLYDVVFAQIIAPIVVGTSLQTSERTKKIIQEIISCFLLFIIVLLVFKIYLIVILWIMQQSYFNFVIKCFLFIGGAKFVIDGPDLVTKLIGIDAGVKSGYGALMGTQSALRTVTSATKSAYNTASNAKNLLVGNNRTGSNGVVGAVNSVASGVVNAPRNVAESVGRTVGNIGGRIDNIRSHMNNANSYGNSGNAFNNNDGQDSYNPNSSSNNAVNSTDDIFPQTSQPNSNNSNSVNIDSVKPDSKSNGNAFVNAKNSAPLNHNNSVENTNTTQPTKKGGLGAFINSAVATSSIGNAFRSARETARAEQHQRQNNIDDTVSRANQQNPLNKNVSRDTSTRPRTYAEQQMDSEKRFDPKDFD